MINDARIQDEVIAELKWDPAINATQIGVEVKGGIVTLTGHVDSYGEKCNAERAAQRVTGVKALAVEIEVNLLGLSMRDDVDIARAVENVLEWSTYLPQDSVKVVVQNGWVTLSGEVEWAYQRHAAADAVRHLLGVKGISNDIEIHPKLSFSALRSEIEQALKRSAKIDAEQILIEIDGSTVTLSGAVHTWAERELAKNSVWGTPGVRKVVDHLTMAG